MSPLCSKKTAEIEHEKGKRIDLPTLALCDLSLTIWGRAKRPMAGLMLPRILTITHHKTDDDKKVSQVPQCLVNRRLQVV